MQNIISRPTTIASSAVKSYAIDPTWLAGLAKKAAYRIDLIGVVTLLIAAGSYCILALLHVA